MSQPAPISPQKWIEHARELAEHRSGRGRPRSTLLRRASSTAYYALFHEIVLDVTGIALRSGTTAERYELARTFDHSSTKDCCSWVAGRSSPPTPVRQVVARLSSGPLLRVSRTFCDLQQARHDADYDHCLVVSKQASVAHVDRAERAIRDYQEASVADREAFAMLAMTKGQLRKR